MKIQLLFFPDCPNVDATRIALRDALAAEKLVLPIEEIDVEDPRAPEWARGWGSPTILIDGKDVYDQASSGASACRLYAHGAPSVEVIRSRLAGAHSPNGNRIALPMIGAITAAIAASACCLVPAVLAVVGVSGAGFASRFAPYRAYFLIASAVALAAGFRFAYRRDTDDCGCEAPRRRRAARVGLWITTLATVILAAYPLLGSDNATAGASEAEARATLILRVTGMDCKECTSTIANRIKKVAGVVSATAEFPSGKAIVRHDGRDGMSSAAIKAVEDAGYRAEVQP
ncbi:MAG TPA: mercuric transporter MerT family protein [Kofleriaceae bacterium]|jgi:copper chaperone CopZ